MRRRSFLPRVHAVCALLGILLLTIPVPEAYAAPSTSISDLQYPAHIVLGTSKYADGIPVAFQVHWTGARQNDLLLMGVLDDQTQDFAEGSTDITGCLLSRGGTVFEKKGRAYCALLLPKSSEGWTRAAFHVKLQSLGTHYLLAKAMLADSYGRSRAGSVSLSPRFSVEVTSTLSLTVSVPSGVTVTLDGVAQQTGTVSAGVGVGSHTLSIPDLVPVDSVTRLRFDRWTDGSTSSNRLLRLEDDAQFEAVYVKQFLLTTRSPYGNATGGGWYDEGTTATFSVATPQPMSGLYGLLGGKYVFSRWSGGSTANTPTASAKMDGPKTVTAMWSVDYRTPVLAFAMILILALMPLLYVFRKGKAAPTPPLQQPASPPAGRVTRPIPEAVRVETPASLSIVSPLVTQRCSCGRTKDHLHYSSNHDFFVRFGLVCFVIVEGLAIVRGAVHGSTFLTLYGEELRAYDLVTRATETLLAPYDYLWIPLIVTELAVLILIVASFATLHSIKDLKTHRITVAGATVLFIGNRSLAMYSSHLQDEALGRLQTLVCQWTPSDCSSVMQTATSVDERFITAYGFWGPPSLFLVAIFAIACLALLVAGSLTTKVVSTWQSTPWRTPVSPIPVRESAIQSVESPAVMPTEGRPAAPTKFCRHCGARIPRVSKYCEECGRPVT